MHWPTSEGSGAARSLAQRVARVTAASTVAGAIFASAIALLIADGLVRREEDRRISEAATSVLHEIVDEPDELGDTVREESRELAEIGLRVAVFRGGRWSGGDRRLALVEAGRCGGAASDRRCAAGAGALRVVVANRGSAADRWRSARILASLLAVLLAAVGGAAVSGAVARRVVAPLVRLRDAVSGVSAARPGEARLGDDEGIAEVDALRVAIAALLHRLDGALVQSRRFSADAAHELRTPLTALRTELELLSEAHRDDERVAEPLARAVQRTVALGDLLEQLLILARPLEAMPSFVELVDLPGLVEDAQLELPSAKRARISVHSDPDVGAIRGDPTLLRALVRNAIDNALKFSGQAPVDVEVRERQGAVFFEVRDQGPGIPVEERERVFEAFHRAAVARASQPGHGIGLALIAHVAAAHGGRAAFVDADRGAHLRVSFPSAASTKA